MLKKRLVLFAAVLCSVISTSSWAGIKVAGDVTLSDGGEVVFSDGSVQSQAQVKGPAGPQGSAGPANKLTIGTVTPGALGAATITGTAPNQVLNLTLPQGLTGPKGDTGAQGPLGQVSLESLCNALSAAHKLLPSFCIGPDLTSIAVPPVSLYVGIPIQLSAQLTYSDSFVESVGHAVVWSSSNASAATVTRGGLVTPVASGTTTITASSGAVAGAAQFTVTVPASSGPGNPVSGTPGQ